MQESKTPKVLGILSIVLGAMGFFPCVAILVLPGLVCGIVGVAIAKDSGHKRLCIIGIIVSVVSFLGDILLWTVLGSYLMGTSSISEPFVYTR